MSHSPGLMLVCANTILLHGQISISCINPRGSPFLRSHLYLIILFVLVCRIRLLCDWSFLLGTRPKLAILLRIIDFRFHIIGLYVYFLFLCYYLKRFSFSLMVSLSYLWTCHVGYFVSLSLEICFLVTILFILLQVLFFLNAEISLTLLILI